MYFGSKSMQRINIHLKRVKLVPLPPEYYCVFQVSSVDYRCSARNLQVLFIEHGFEYTEPRRAQRFLVNLSNFSFHEPYQDSFLRPEEYYYQYSVGFLDADLNMDPQRVRLCTRYISLCSRYCSQNYLLIFLEPISKDFFIIISILLLLFTLNKHTKRQCNRD